MKYPKIFIEEISRESGGGSNCHICKNACQKSHCDKHLKFIAQRFRTWVKKRYRMGKCYQCNRARLYGEQRCYVHKNINKNRCLKWARRNREAIRAESRRRRELGVCVNSPSHGAVYNKHILCYKCFITRKQARQSK